jgi:PAS domain-containing protein
MLTTRNRQSLSHYAIWCVSFFESNSDYLEVFNQDLVFIEEAFERLMLDYDRVFSCMGIPACLWRRTGEIYKGNREFAELVGVEGYMLRDVSFPGLIPFCLSETLF